MEFDNRLQNFLICWTSIFLQTKNIFLLKIIRCIQTDNDIRPQFDYCTHILDHSKCLIIGHFKINSHFHINPVIPISI